MTGILVRTGISVKVKFHWIYGFFANSQDFSAYHISKQERLRRVCANDWNLSGHWNLSEIPLNIWLLCQYTRFQCLPHHAVSSKGSGECVQMTGITVGTGISVKFHWIYGHIASIQDFSAYHISKQQRFRWVCANDCILVGTQEFQWNSTKYMASLPLHKISVLTTSVKQQRLRRVCKWLEL